jgi:hypothetical protein
MKYTNDDIALRLSSVLYDSCWSMLSSPTNVAAKLTKLQKHVKGGSVVSAMTATPENFRDLEARIEMLRTLLGNAATAISDEEFEAIVVTCLKASDLYPSFRDTFTMIKQIHPDINETPTQIFKRLFVSACEVIVASDLLLKNVCTPTSTSQPQFSLCRKRFCAVMADETAYVDAAFIVVDDDDKSENDDTMSIISSRHAPSVRGTASRHTMALPDVLLEDEEDEEEPVTSPPRT